MQVHFLSNCLLHSNGLTLEIKLSDPSSALLAIQILSNIHNETSKLGPMAINLTEGKQTEHESKSFRRQ